MPVTPDSYAIDYTGGNETGLACTWDVDTSRCCDRDDQRHDRVLESAAALASAILSRRSGFTIGLCSRILRPLGACPTCRSRCCGAGDWMHLNDPAGLPVYSVETVRLGPDEVPVDQWRFDPDTSVLWAVPPMTWPLRDEAWSRCGAGEAFCVDATVGTAPDAWALDVAAVLTCELWKSARGDKCRLPRNVTQVTGQGVTVSLSDSELTDLLPEVTAWVAAVNPHHAVLPAKLWSPDVNPARGTGRGRPGCCG